MPRLQTIDPSTDAGPGADLLNGPLKDKQINIFKGLAINPPVLEAFLQFMQGVRGGGTLSQKEHEVVNIAASQSAGCEYCLAAHTQIAKGHGLSEDAALDVRRGSVDDPRLQALVDFTRAVVDTGGDVSDDQLQAFRDAGFEDRDVVAVIGEIAVARFTNVFNHVHRTEIDFPVPATV